MDSRKRSNFYFIMRAIENAVVLLSLICFWYLKTACIPKL